MLLALIVMALLFKIPIADSETITETITADGSLESVDHPVLSVTNGLILGLILLSIFLYKNRKTQLKINAVNMLFILALPVVGYFLLRAEAGTSPLLQITAGTFFPAVAILFLIVANRSIRSDEKLVRSADRLR